jgi:hypothetical protein
LADELQIDAAAESLDIDGMDEIFGAVFGELIEQIPGEGETGEGLPAIGHNPVGAVALAATQIQDQSFATHGGYQGPESIQIELPCGKIQEVTITCDAPASSQCGRCQRMDSTANLKSAGIRRECFARGRFVARSEHDDMTACELVAAVEFGVPGGGPV